MAASITLDGSTLLYQTPYHPGLVAALKAAIPSVDRRWDSGRKVWRVSPVHGATLAALTKQYLGDDVQVPLPNATPAAVEKRILDVRYIGVTKDRGDGAERTAFGYIAGEWAAVFPESVLRQWFGQEKATATRPAGNTLYAVLGIVADAGTDDVRKAYRRLARQWHPDVCREPDAAEMFLRIQHAYEVLGDPGKRGRYDAGLTLAASIRRPPKPLPPEIGYRAPLRCGYLLVEGREQLGRFVVETILAWEDIQDGDGRVLVSSWPAGADAPVEDWHLA